MINDNKCKQLDSDLYDRSEQVQELTDENKVLKQKLTTTGGQADELQKLRKQLEKKLNDRKQGNNQLLTLIEEKTKEFDKKNFDNEETIRK